MLASDTARTKAYIQMMIREKLLPSLVIIYTDDFEIMERDAETYRDNEDNQETTEYFNLNEPILYSIQKAEIDYTVVENKDINSDEIRFVIGNLSQEYLIYSGYGGYILKAHLFKMGKKYVHVHAGILPRYRGSTTAYYSMLQENYIGATAIFLSEGIDEGKIITSEKYQRTTKDVNIDIVYEPYLRSLVLKKVLNQYQENGILTGTEQDNTDAQTYYIIHPVLKHIALMTK